MKRTIVVTLIAATLVIAVIAAGCSTPVPAAKVQQNTAQTPVEYTRINANPMFTDDPENVQEVLSTLHQSTLGMINTYKFLNQPVPDKLVAAQQVIEEASMALQRLEEDRQVIIKSINEYKFLVQPVPDGLTDALKRIEDQRQVILIRCGLVD